MSTPLVVVGAGGFGREVLDVVNAANAAGTHAPFELIGVLDDHPSQTNLARLESRHVEHLGAVDGWIAKDRRADYIIAIGDPKCRREVAWKFGATEMRPAILIHPYAVIGSAGEIGPGSVICSGVQVSTNVRIGAHVHLNPNVTVGHDAVLADYVSVNPAATVSGGCSINEGALLGAASVVLQRLVVGAGATVGAAACVVRDVPEGVVVRGVPAR